MWKRLRNYTTDSKEPRRYKYVTKYQITQALGSRGTELASNKPTLVHIKNETNPENLAVLELEENVLPDVIKLTNDDDTVEYWELDDDQDVYRDCTPL